MTYYVLMGTHSHSSLTHSLTHSLTGANKTDVDKELLLCIKLLTTSDKEVMFFLHMSVCL